MTGGKIGNAFHRFARAVSDAAGHPAAFTVALALIVVWAISGPFLGFSEVWQLTINTVTTIITFLMVFVIQHTQNINEKAMQTKLDEIVGAIDKADNSLIGIEKED